jgi:orotate phosphoribosyltransferase
MTSPLLPDELVHLLGPRKGHFQLPSGHHGELWLDLETAFIRIGALRPFVTSVARLLSSHGVEAVCGPLAGGAFVAELIAVELGAEFYYAECRMVGPDSGPFEAVYCLPERLQRAIRGRRVAVVDDVINAASAIDGTLRHLRFCGATVVAVGALLALGPAAESLARTLNVPLACLARLGHAPWSPAECPLCAAGIPLET